MTLKLVHNSSKLNNQKDSNGMNNSILHQSIHVSPILGGGGRGIKKYGKISVVNIMNKYKKLHTLSVFLPQDPSLMSRQEQHRSLRAENIIQEKRCGNIKGITGTEGIPQQNYIQHKEGMLLTIKLEALFA